MLNLLTTLDTYLLDDIYGMAYRSQFQDCMRELKSKLEPNFWAWKPMTWVEVTVDGYRSKMIYVDKLNTAMGWHLYPQLLNKMICLNSIKFRRDIDEDLYSTF